jgi:subtilase family serine protease
MDSREATGRMKRRLAPALLVLLLMVSIIPVAGGAEDLAELVVVRIVLDPPPVIDRGMTVEVRAHVMNTGTRTADGFSISLFYRSQDSQGSWTLHRTLEDVTLPPSQQESYVATFYIETMDLQLGTYDVRIVADATNRISETDKLNNELRTTMTLRDSSLGLPDLQAISLSYTRSNPGSEDDMEPWNIATQIQNRGSVQAGQFVVAFLANGVEFARQIRFVLPAGGSTDIAAELDPQELGLLPGTHTITVQVDPENAVEEQDEFNNSISGFLTLQAVDLVPVSLSFDKSVVRMDEEVQVTAEIRNDGKGVAKNVEVGFYVGHIRFALTTLPILGRGMTATAEGILHPSRAGLTDAPEVYQIRVVADPNEVLYEVDKANNEMIRPLTLHPADERKPEIHPVSIELSPASPAELGKAGTITVSTMLRNTGRAAAEGFKVAFYYRVKGGVRWEQIPCGDATSCLDLRLAPGMQSKHVAVLPVTNLPPGVYEIRVLTDPEGTLDELDTTNNELSTTLTLLGARLPDLAFCPAAPVTQEPTGEVQQGQTVRFNLCVANLGEQAASAFSLRASYCRLSGTGASGVACDDESRVTGFVPGPEISVSGLNIGESRSLPIMLETTGLSPGQYRVRVEIDPSESISERNVANNLLEMQVTVLGADLTVLDVRTQPASPVDQEQFDRLDVTATILNAGVLPAGAFNVQFRLLRLEDGGLVPVSVQTCGEGSTTECREVDHFGTATFSGLGVFSPTSVNCSLDLSAAELLPGQYVLVVEIDPEGRVAEHNELNNLIELPIVIVGQRLPDLVSSELQMGPEDWAKTPDPVSFVVTVSNEGKEAAGPFDVLLRVYRFDPTETCEEGIGRQCAVQIHQETRAVAGLLPEDARELVWTVDTGLLAPGFSYFVAVDADCSRLIKGVCVGSVEESDETNNRAEIFFVRENLPDLVAGQFRIAPEDQAETLDPVSFVLTASNEGEAAAGPFDVLLRIYRFIPTETCDAGIGRQCAVQIHQERRAVVGLLPEDTRELVWTVDTALLAPEFSYFVTADVDCSRLIEGVCVGSVEESDETNNQAEISFGPEEIPSPGAGCDDSVCPDLSVRSVYSNMVAGEIGIAQVVATIENIGDADAGSFTVRAYYVPRHGADPVKIETEGHRERFSGLEAGKSKLFRQEFDTSVIPQGVYELFVVVDEDREVPELDEEENNTASTLLWIY